MAEKVANILLSPKKAEIVLALYQEARRGKTFEQLKGELHIRPSVLGYCLSLLSKGGIITCSDEIYSLTNMGYKIANSVRYVKSKTKDISKEEG